MPRMTDKNEQGGADRQATPCRLSVPKSFHWIWVGGSLPDSHSKFMQTWQDLHPGFNVCLWDDDTLPEICMANADLYHGAEDLAPEGRAGQFKSDIARLELLYQFGGIYVDTDFECLKPIHALIEKGPMMAWETDGQWLNNAIMAAPPGDPFIKLLITGLAESVRKGAGLPPNMVTGPQYLTRQWEQMLPSWWRVYDAKLFYPYRWDELDRAGEEFPEAYAVHHWANKRRKAGIPCP